MCQEENREGSQIWDPLGILRAVELNICQLPESLLCHDPLFETPQTGWPLLFPHHFHYYAYWVHWCSLDILCTVEKHFPDDCKWILHHLCVWQGLLSSLIFYPWEMGTERKWSLTRSLSQTEANLELECGNFLQPFITCPLGEPAREAQCEWATTGHWVK
jgi:hypothetical protein